MFHVQLHKKTTTFTSSRQKSSSSRLKKWVEIKNNAVEKQCYMMTIVNYTFNQAIERKINLDK